MIIQKPGSGESIPVRTVSGMPGTSLAVRPFIRPMRSLLIVGASIAVIEAGLMFALAPLPNGYGKNLLDAGLLIVLVLPVLHVFLFRPLVLAAEGFRRAEKAEIRMLGHIVEHSPAVVIITAKNGDILSVNRKFCEMSGYAAAEAVGRNPRFLRSGELLPEYYKNLWDTILAGREWRGEFHNKKKNGEHFWVSASISSLKNDRGEIIDFIYVGEDITEKKRLTEAVLEDEEKCRMFLSTTSAAVIFHDVESKRIIDANAAALKLYQYGREEFLNLNIWELSAEPEQTLKTLDGLKLGKITTVPLRWHRKKDGTPIPVEICGGMFKDRGRKTIFGIILDISARIEAEQKLATPHQGADN